MQVEKNPYMALNNHLEYGLKDLLNHSLSSVFIKVR